MKRVIFALPLLAVGGLGYVAMTTRPDTIGPVGMLIVFVLLYLFWVGIFVFFTDVLFALRRRLTGKTTRRNGGLRAYYVASILAFVPVLILAIQSVNQLTVRDLLLVVGLVAMAIFYVIKRT